ncbi:hypothetical protein MMC28_011459 [Mycoblastus sanguinarius]|nr:hypothetical protein [Mycoblastus sanguinarius]
MSQIQTHTDSIDGQEHDEVQKKPKSRRPASKLNPLLHFEEAASPWNGQGLTEVPILTPKTVLPLFFIVGIIFAPIGGLLLYASAQVQEIVIDYSDCQKLAPNSTDFVKVPSKYTSSSFKGSDQNCTKELSFLWKQNSTTITYGVGTPPVNTSICSLQFNLPDNLSPPVLFYYRLTNFYQNHRRYVKSLDTDQLKGQVRSNNSLGDCNPLQTDSNGKAYYPCGLIANSLFNDTFSNPVQLNPHFSSANNITYNMTESGIAWSSDSALYGPTQYNYSDITVPPNWHLRWQNGYSTENPPPNLKEDEAFQVWMRTAGLPNFSKLAKRNDNETMQCSMYQVDITNNFPVDVYGGTKSIVISTRTVMGGKNPFLGIAYVAVGGICIVLGTLFTVTHLIKPRKLGDHTYLSWNNDQPSTATATGISRPGNDAA